MEKFNKRRKKKEEIGIRMNKILEEIGKDF
jgi:hypothetical protein